MDTSKTAYTWNEMLMVPVEELPARSRVPIEIFDDPKDMFYQLARRVVDTVKSNNEKGLKTRIAWPVGPKKLSPDGGNVNQGERLLEEHHPLPGR